jgi:hypothetical protein
MKTINFWLAFTLYVLSCSVVQAAILPLGKVGGNMFAYDSDTVADNDNIRSVWVLTSHAKYNIMNSKSFGLLGIHMRLDCASHAYAIDDIVELNKRGEMIGRTKVTDIKFRKAAANTIPQALLARVCKTIG